MVRPATAWIALSVIGAAVFGVLTWLSVLWGTGLGIAYTGDQELVEFTIAFAATAGVYAVLAFELWWHRTRLPKIEIGNAWFIGVAIGLGGPLLAFLLCAMLYPLR